MLRAGGQRVRVGRADAPRRLRPWARLSPCAPNRWTLAAWRACRARASRSAPSRALSLPGPSDAGTTWLARPGTEGGGGGRAPCTAAPEPPRLARSSPRRPACRQALHDQRARYGVAAFTEPTLCSGWGRVRPLHHGGRVGQRDVDRRGRRARASAKVHLAQRAHCVTANASILVLQALHHARRVRDLHLRVHMRKCLHRLQSAPAAREGWPLRQAAEMRISAPAASPVGPDK